MSLISNQHWLAVVLIFCSVFANVCRAQHLETSDSTEWYFEVNHATEIPLAAISASYAVYSQWLKSQLPGLSSRQIIDADRGSVPAFDRISIDNYRPDVARASDWLLFGASAAPLLLLADREVRRDWVAIGIMGLEVYSINFAFTNTVKTASLRKRPLVYNNAVPVEEKQKASATTSFWSGHTSTVAASTFFTASVLTRYTDHKGIKIAGWSAAVIIPAFMAGMRVRAGKHFPSDVAAGYAFGAFTGVLIPYLHRKTALPENLSWMIMGGSGGAYFSMSWQMD